MQCLTFRNALLGVEDRAQRTPRVSGIYQGMGRDAESPTHALPYELTEKISSIQSYQPPKYTASGFRCATPKYVHMRRQNEYRRHEHEVPLLQDGEERERRFQEVYVEHRQGQREEKRQPKAPARARPPLGIEKDMEDMLVSETERVDTDLSMLVNKDGSAKRGLHEENQRLQDELRGAGKTLDHERSQKHALLGRIGKLENQVEKMRAEQRRDLNENQKQSVFELHRQLGEYKEKLAEEQAKAQMLQLRVDSLKKENQRSRDRMKIMMFQHLPGASLKLKDIGPCNTKVHESPNQIGDYELGIHLGEGHYGKVAVGTNLVTGHKFAVKVLNKDRITRFKDLQQVGMEVHVLKQYAHPNIVHLQEVIHAAEKLYLVTELCLMDLHNYHNDVGLSEYGAQMVVFGVLKPLYHLHSHGISHLDLKPENVLLTADADINNITHYDIRLCDFGLVKMAKNPNQSKDIVRKGYACGTPGFFAPEMILENQFEGRQADMWSLGCIILELTLGFTQDWIESYDQVETDPEAFRRGLEACLEEIAPGYYPGHPNLLDIIHSCLSIEAKKRIDTSDALVHPWLEEILEHDEGRQDPSDKFQGMHSSKTKENLIRKNAKWAADFSDAILC